MYLLLVIVVYILFSIYLVDWKRWNEFYPTILYFIVCNLMYNFIFYNHTLWSYKAQTVTWLNHTIIDLAFTLFIVPVIIMLYLRFYPSSGWKRYTYVGVWVCYFSVIEWIFTKKGLFSYENGWNLKWSILFNLIMFVLLRLHYKKPLAAMLVSIPVIAVLLFFFHPPFSQLK